MHSEIGIPKTRLRLLDAATVQFSIKINSRNELIPVNPTYNLFLVAITPSARQGSPYATCA